METKKEKINRILQVIKQLEQGKPLQTSKLHVIKSLVDDTELAKKFYGYLAECSYRHFSHGESLAQTEVMSHDEKAKIYQQTIEILLPFYSRGVLTLQNKNKLLDIVDNIFEHADDDVRISVHATRTNLKDIEGMSLGLHSLLFPTKVKATAADMTCNLALFASDSRTLTNRLGGSSCSAALHLMFLGDLIHFSLNRDFSEWPVYWLVQLYCIDYEDLRIRLNHNSIKRVWDVAEFLKST